MKYAIIMYNFNNYEIMRDVPNYALDNEIEYIYITDNSNLKAKNWKIIIDHDLDNLSPFDKCYSVRFNLFKYTSAEYIMYIDGSIQILQNPKIYFEQFIKSNCDISVCVHPSRTNIFDEYVEWVRIRNYDKQQAFKCLSYMSETGYDAKNYKGLYQGGFRVFKNTKIQKQLDIDCYNILKQLGNNNKIERLDQTIYSFLLNTKYKNLKLFPYDDSCIFSKYLNIQGHNQPFIFNKQPNRPYIKNGFVRNEFIKLNTI